MTHKDGKGTVWHGLDRIYGCDQCGRGTYHANDDPNLGLEPGSEVPPECEVVGWQTGDAPGEEFIELCEECAAKRGFPKSEAASAGS